MDIASLLSSTVPSYFVVGPLVIILVTLFVLVAKRSNQAGIPLVINPSSVPVTAQPAAQAVVGGTVPPVVQQVTDTSLLTSLQTPISQTPAVGITTQTQQTPIPTPVPIPEPVVVQIQTPEQHVIQEEAPTIHEGENIPQANAEAVVTPLPELVTTPLVKEQIPVTVPLVSSVVPTPSETVLPPISSWKPTEPVIVPVDATHSEKDIQNEAQIKAS